LSRLSDIANRYEPRIRNGLIRAFNQIRSKTSLRELEVAIRASGVEGVMNYMKDTPGIISQQIRDDLDDAIRDSGRASISLVPKGAVVDATHRFSTTNPFAARAIRNYELNLIQGISSDTVSAVRNAVEADILSGANPRSTARVYRNTIGLTPSQERAVRNYNNSLKNLDTDALDRKLRDGRFDSKVRRAIQDGKPLAAKDVERMTQRYRERYIKYRSEVIARTESLRAVSIGNQMAMDQMVQTGAIDKTKVRKHWVYTRDARTRNEHVKIPMLNPNGVEIDGFFTTPLGPLKFPRDPMGAAGNTIQCRCAVVYRPVKDGGSVSPDPVVPPPAPRVKPKPKSKPRAKKPAALAPPARKFETWSEKDLFSSKKPKPKGLSVFDDPPKDPAQLKRLVEVNRAANRNIPGPANSTMAIKKRKEAWAKMEKLNNAYARTLTKEELRTEKINVCKDMLRTPSNMKWTKALDNKLGDATEWIPFDVLNALRADGLTINFSPKTMSQYRAYFRKRQRGTDPSVWLAKNENYDVIAHELGHAVDHLFSGGRSTTGMNWANGKFVSAADGQKLREIYTNYHGSKKIGQYSNGDGAYWKANWMTQYEGRIYKHVFDAGGEDSEWWSMNIQRYAGARVGKRAAGGWSKAQKIYEDLAEFIETKFGRDFITDAD